MLQYPDPIDLTGAKLFLLNMNENCKQLNLTKVLIDARNRTSTSFNSEQLLELGMFMAQLIQNRIKVAVLVNYKPEVHGFFKALTDAKGVILDFFGNESIAKKWLDIDEVDNSLY